MSLILQKNYNDKILSHVGTAEASCPPVPYTRTNLSVKHVQLGLFRLAIVHHGQQPPTVLGSVGGGAVGYKNGLSGEPVGSDEVRLHFLSRGVKLHHLTADAWAHACEETMCVFFAHFYLYVSLAINAHLLRSLGMRTHLIEPN